MKLKQIEKNVLYYSLSETIADKLRNTASHMNYTAEEIDSSLNDIKRDVAILAKLEQDGWGRYEGEE